MLRFLFFISVFLFFVNCTTTKVDLKKLNLAETNIVFNTPSFQDFKCAFKALQPTEAYNLAETEAQKLAAEGLNYVIQSKYDEAIEKFVEALSKDDKLSDLLLSFIIYYHSIIVHDEEKFVKRSKIIDLLIDSSFVFYNVPDFPIEFLEDSVAIPIILKKGVPLIQIKFNGKYYSFLIDTGCDKTFISKKLANISDVVYVKGSTPVNTIDGKLNASAGVLPQVDLGKIKISNLPVWITNKNDALNLKFLLITIFKCDGVIGWDLLNKFDFSIDYKNKNLILRKYVKKDIKHKNLFWYRFPIVKFYCDNYPVTAFLDTGSGLTAFYQKPTLTKILGLDTNILKKKTKRLGGGAGNIIKEHYYKYPKMQLYTIVKNDINYINVEKVFFKNTFTSTTPVNIDVLLGSDLFSDKIIRVDMLNGIFEIE